MLFFTIIIACSGKSSDTASDINSDLNEDESLSLITEFEAQLVGVFDSTEQSQSNSSYYAVKLTACPVDAPEIGEHVLYIEQALADTPQSPYRQRLYRLDQIDEETVQSAIYELNRPNEAIGLCDETELRTYTNDDVTLRNGCEVTLTWDGEGFFGSTGETDCQSDMNGASYATSEVLTRPDRIESWDRGWAANGTQAWGATAGAYIFIRRQ